MDLSRKAFLHGIGASGALSLFNIGCAGFGDSRRAQLAKGGKIRIAIVGCGDWGRTLLNRAGLVGGCELVALCEPDPKAIPLAIVMISGRMPYHWWAKNLPVRP